MRDGQYAMEATALKQRIDSIDPMTHGSLRAALLAQVEGRSVPEAPFSTTEPTEVDLPTMPYINEYGTLIIPFASLRRYHYWRGGQSILETLRELGASDEVISHYTRKEGS